MLTIYVLGLVSPTFARIRFQSDDEKTLIKEYSPCTNPATNLALPGRELGSTIAGIQPNMGITLQIQENLGYLRTSTQPCLCYRRSQECYSEGKLKILNRKGKNMLASYKLVPWTAKKLRKPIALPLASSNLKSDISLSWSY